MKLKALFSEVSLLVEKYGPNSEVAAFIFTEKDVQEISKTAFAPEVLNDFMHHHTTLLSTNTVEDFLLEEFQRCVRGQS